MVKQKAKAKPKKPSVPRKPKVKKPKVEKVKELKPPKKKDVIDKLYRERLLRAKGSLGPRSAIFSPKDRQPVLDDKKYEEKLDYLYKMLLLAAHRPPKPQRAVAMDISESDAQMMSDVPPPREPVFFPQRIRRQTREVERKPLPSTRKVNRKSERDREQNQRQPTTSESDSDSPTQPAAGPSRQLSNPPKKQSQTQKDSSPQTRLPPLLLLPPAAAEANLVTQNKIPTLSEEESKARLGEAELAHPVLMPPLLLPPGEELRDIIMEDVEGRRRALIPNHLVLERTRSVMLDRHHPYQRPKKKGN